MTEQIIDCMGAILVRDSNAPRVIRFKDKDFRDLFYLRDGGSINVTFPDGTTKIWKCDYGDDAHTVVDGCMYHVDEFNERVLREHLKISAVEGDEVFDKKYRRYWAVMQMGHTFYGAGEEYDEALNDALEWLPEFDSDRHKLAKQLKSQYDANDGDLCALLVTRHTYDLIKQDGIKAYQFWADHEDYFP